MAQMPDWHVQYRRHEAEHIGWFPTPEFAIEAACGLIDDGCPPPSHGGRRSKGAEAGRERPAKRLDRPTPCGGGPSCEIGHLFLHLLSSHVHPALPDIGLR